LESSLSLTAAVQQSVLEASVTDMPFAYSLAQAESGWAWRILDEQGETVAQGVDLNQLAAQAAVEHAIRQAAAETRL
jgi:hypothetical protein